MSLFGPLERGKQLLQNKRKKCTRLFAILFKKSYGKAVAENVAILYGGSVKPANAQEIFSKPDVDGGLIGGAALNADDFFAIVQSI